MSTGAWKTRFGFYLAAIGSAFGLGNVWRFPYVVAENGGGAFVLLYVFLVFVVGMPLLIAELLIGKVTRKSVISALESLSGEAANPAIAADPRGGLRSPPFAAFRLSPWIGRMAVLLSLLVLAYFAVISGWVLHFLMQFLVGALGTGVDPVLSLAVLRANGWLQILLTSVHLLLVIVIVAKGVEDGIEKWVGYMMSLFVVLLAGLAVKSLTLETTPAALRFFLYPDFSQLSGSSLGQALGHVLFTLSVGFGMMVTFGSYMRERSYIPIAGFRVAAVDSFISLFAGLLIFPLVMAGAASSGGPELLFQTVPVLLSRIPGGPIFGVGFFLCLYLAALGASIGLLECVVANLRDTDKLKREKAAWWAGGLCFFVAVFPALSSSYLAGVRYGDKGLLELIDQALINWCLPLVALGLSQVVAYRLEEKVKRAEFAQEEGPTSQKLFSHWVFAVRWLVPGVIVLALSLQVVDLFV